MHVQPHAHISQSYNVSSPSHQWQQAYLNGWFDGALTNG